MPLVFATLANASYQATLSSGGPNVTSSQTVPARITQQAASAEEDSARKLDGSATRPVIARSFPSVNQETVLAQVIYVSLTALLMKTARTFTVTRLLATSANVRTTCVPTNRRQRSVEL